MNQMLVPHDVFWNVPHVADPSDILDASAPPTRNAFDVFEFRDKHVQVTSKRILRMSEGSRS